MPIKISQPMLYAMFLLKTGEAKTAYRAAQLAGIHQSTISRSRLYKEWKSKQENAK